MVIKSKYKFYIIIFVELLFAPWLYFINMLKWNFGNPAKVKLKYKSRAPVLTNNLAVSVHEWGGYQGKRTKKIKNIVEFQCGLDYQIERFQNYKGKYKLDITITVSDSHLLKNEIKNEKVIEVSNIGMDFSGYSSFFETIKNLENQYVILSNSSVNMLQTQFIDDYLDFFKDNSCIGMLGVSFNSKMQQTFISNNFNPHLQSFFLLTTTEVLKEVVDKNKSFPGKDIDHKLDLIRNGEIKLSRIVMDLGYKLVSILEDGTPYFFDRKSFLDNGKNSWSTSYGDYRLHLRNPNTIHPLKLNLDNNNNNNS